MCDIEKRCFPTGIPHPFCADGVGCKIYERYLTEMGNKAKPYAIR